MTILRQNQEAIDAFWESRIWKEIKSLAYALVVAFGIRSVFLHPFNIPSGSMYPTLMIGDFLVVSKYSYGYTRYSLPFPLYHFLPQGKILHREPTRGAVVVFRNPLDDDKDYIKRLVGLPGDRIQVKDGVLHINGDPVKLRRIDDYHRLSNGVLQVIPQYIETLPNGVEHRILKLKPFGDHYLDNTEEWTVPAGHYFMMGDNRDESQDSRVAQMVGFVPAEHLLGEAQILFFSTDAKWYEVDQWLPGMRFERFMTMIR